MQFKGKIATLGSVESGVSQRNPGKEWRRRMCVVEELAARPRRLAFWIWNDMIDASPVATGQEVTVDFELDSREHEGRWYVDVLAYRITPAL